MPYIATPRRSLRQPKTIQRLDTSYGLARDCVLAVVPPLGHTNLAQRGTPIALTWSAPPGQKIATRSGIATKIVNNTAYWDAVIDAGRCYTVAYLGRLEGDIYGNALEGYTSSSAATLVLRDWGQTQGVIFGTTDQVAASSVGYLTASELVNGAFLAITAKDNYAGTFEINTYRGRVFSSAQNFGTGRDLYRLRVNYSWRNWFNYQLVLAWRRALHRDEIFALADSPWSIFESRPFRIYPFFSSGSTQSGDGSSSGTSTVAGQGASLFSSAGSAAGVATVTGIGSAVFAATGASAGAATVSGTGTALIPANGVSAGVATAVAQGQALTVGIGSSAGTSTVAGQGASLFSATGAAAGAATASGVGAAIVEGVGNAAGTSTASADILALWEANGTAAGVALATAQGKSIAIGNGTAAGVATASGEGIALSAGEGQGVSAGTSTATGQGQATVTATGTAAGTSTASADILAIWTANGVAAGSALVTAEGQVIAAGDGFAAGIAFVIGEGSTLADIIGNGAASGSSTAVAQGQAIWEAVGTSDGFATVLGVPLTGHTNIGGLEAFVFIGEDEEFVVTRARP